MILSHWDTQEPMSITLLSRWGGSPLMLSAGQFLGQVSLKQSCHYVQLGDHHECSCINIHKICLSPICPLACRLLWPSLPNMLSM
jgi:hypothetical protein